MLTEKEIVQRQQNAYLLLAIAEILGGAFLMGLCFVLFYPGM